MGKGRRLVALIAKSILIGCLSLTSISTMLVGSHLTASKAQAAGTNYFVDSAIGSDLNPGTSRSLPWRTIQKAANTAVASDSVTVLAGNFNERVQITRSGASGAPITYQTEGTVVTRGFTVRANYITIRGFEVTNTPNLPGDGVGIFVEGSYCVIADNYVHYATRGGILIYTGPGEDSLITNCLVRNNRLYRNSQYGIEIHGRDHIVEGNEISHTIQYHPAWLNPPSWVDADGIRFFGIGHRIRRNYIHDITYNDPENVNPYIDCFVSYVVSPYYEAASTVILEKNICKAAESLAPGVGGTAIALTGANHLIIRNNILHAYMHVGAPQGNSELTIVNNVMTSDLSLPLKDWPEAIWMQDCPNTVIKNNIFYNLPAHVYWIPGPPIPGLDIGYNIAYRSDGRPVWDQPYPHDLWNVNPQFRNPGAGDFHLQANSPAIDAGFALTSVTDDFDGVPRPLGGGYDIGAYEYLPYRITAIPPVVRKNDTLIITITFGTNGKPITLTSTIPAQLDYLSSSATCPATLAYDAITRTVTLAGTPPPASNCDFHIYTKVNTDQTIAILILAEVDNGFPVPLTISTTIILNGSPLFLPLIRKG